MIRRLPSTLPAAAILYLLLALAQLFVYTRSMDELSGRWFLYGSDTLAHDAVVHQWVARWHEKVPGSIPLWMPELHGGLPTIGAFLWTPLAPGAIGFPFLVYPDAQRLGWLLSLWIGGIGGFLLARAIPIRPGGALFAGMVWMLCGHVVTLIHAGHFQKVMALGWYPWMVAGGLMVLHPAGGNRRLAGNAIGALGLGMMLLSGHPQIAYTGIATVGILGVGIALGRKKVLLQWRRLAVSLILMGGLGMALGGAQFLPGVEMAGWSNRAQGVEWEEAVATSYPPAEILEYIIPRHLGTSVFGDVYRGTWGDERIVSDYIGIPVVLLAMVGLLLSGRRKVLLLPWIAVILVSLVVGFGSHTPVYRLLFQFVPGFDSFRSPGTFMCAASLALAVLSGAGLEKIIRLAGRLRPGRIHLLLYPAVLVAVALNLAQANRHFLFQFKWDRYRSEFLESNDVDKWIASNRLELNTFEATNDLSLRPILFGRKSVNGYHPITWAARVARDHEEGMYSIDWYESWGVPILIVPKPVEFDEDLFDHLESFQRAGRAALRIRGISGHADGHGLQSVNWSVRNPNERHGTIRGWGGKLRIADAIAPGWRIYLDEVRVETPREPEMSVRLTYPEGTSNLAMYYRPFSWRVGLFSTALGVFGMTLCLGLRRRPRTHSSYFSRFN